MVYDWIMRHRTHPQPDPTREDFLTYRKLREKREHYIRHRYNKNPPEKFLMRTDHFLRMFNWEFSLKGDKALSRRTLQFYSSPQTKLLPLPVYKERHTAHYVFPDHYERLAVIWTLRSRFFFPIGLIRSVLKEISEDHYGLIIDWDENPEALMDTIMMLKQGFEYEDVALYRETKILFKSRPHLLLNPEVSADRATKALLTGLEEQYAERRKWIGSGQAVTFYRKLAEARRSQPDRRERLKESQPEEGE